jgi:P-type conjugative transfer protein TrbJ
MTHILIKRTLAAASVVALLGISETAPAQTLPSPAPVTGAGIPVFDAGSAWNAYNSVLGSLYQISQLETQISNEISMLQSLPFSLLTPVSNLFNAEQNVMQQLAQIQAKGQALVNQLNSTYPTDFTQWVTAANQFNAQVTAMQQQVYQVQTQAMQVHAQILADMPSLNQQLQSAITAGQNATGQTGAIMATNQILGATAEIQNQTLQTLIAHHQAVEQTTMEKQSEQAALDAMTNGPTMTMSGSGF